MEKKLWQTAGFIDGKLATPPREIVIYATKDEMDKHVEFLDSNSASLSKYHNGKIVNHSYTELCAFDYETGTTFDISTLIVKQGEQHEAE